MVAAGALRLAASLSYSAAALQQLVWYPGNLDFSPAAGLSSTAASVSALAGAASTTASILSTYASYERREQEWEFQKTLAQQDVLIGAQQVMLAQDHVRVVGQERHRGDAGEHAEATVDFLHHKFTNAELYDWMSDVLEGVYSYFLQQATAMAKLAEQQLAFERQEPPPPFIQADYWEAPSGLGAAPAGGKAPDRRGLTGSARLLQRHLPARPVRLRDRTSASCSSAKTISLARLAPAEFQRFRETGVMPFATPMEMFDRDFPGHYLRLIRRVRVSVVALIPPTQGIRATLSATGTSRVVIGGDVFQTVVAMRTGRNRLRSLRRATRPACSSSSRSPRCCCRSRGWAWTPPGSSACPGRPTCSTTAPSPTCWSRSTTPRSTASTIASR